MSLIERRNHPRKEVLNVRTWMLAGDGKREQLRVVDMSRKGVHVSSRRLILPGTTVELAFVRTDGDKVTRLVRRCGEVVRASPRGFAVTFAHPRPRGSRLQYRGQQK